MVPSFLAPIRTLLIEPEVGPEAHRALAFRAAETLSNFWKVVYGETKLDLERDQRRMME